MLKQRILTALVLLALLALALTLAAPWGFPLLAALLLIAAIWEWMRLVGLSPRHSLLVAAATGVAIMLLLWGSPLAQGPRNLFLALSAAVWCTLAAFLLVRHRFVPVAEYPTSHAALGVLFGLSCWTGIVAAYEQGIVFMLSILALVWTADIAAYFAGRAFGRHKLAPAISPGKTWEGVAGAVAAVWLLTLISTIVPGLENTLYALLGDRLPLLLVLALLALLTGLSVVGDLFESHLKRQAGVKDSSGFLPGHGGVLDRIDAWLPVIPVAVLMHAWL